MAKKYSDQAVYTPVRSALSHDGVVYQPGEPVTLDVAAAKPLLELGAVEHVDPAAPADPASN
ncbi:MAG: hypothetical protein LCH95_13860 [Proteobacteria bacterium]|nr:hypothetical protein [Pseudomonadota bacterium]